MVWYPSKVKLDNLFSPLTIFFKYHNKKLKRIRLSVQPFLRVTFF